VTCYLEFFEILDLARLNNHPSNFLEYCLVLEKRSTTQKVILVVSENVCDYVRTLN